MYNQDLTDQIPVLMALGILEIKPDTSMGGFWYLGNTHTEN